jgi:hypothetical protein
MLLEHLMSKTCSEHADTLTPHPIQNDARPYRTATATGHEKSKRLSSEGDVHCCIGRESNPGLAESIEVNKIHVLATANFTTKPPMQWKSVSGLQICSFRQHSELRSRLEQSRPLTPIDSTTGGSLNPCISASQHQKSTSRLITVPRKFCTRGTDI